jgi:drug/metabolite transporter (DMT)-like permease
MAVGFLVLIGLIELLGLGAVAAAILYMHLRRAKYHPSSQPSRREEVLFKIAQDISHVSDMQGILALVFSATLAAAIIYALVKATSTESMTAIIQILVPIVSAIVGFYFGRKTAESAA